MASFVQPQDDMRGRSAGRAGAAGRGKRHRLRPAEQRWQHVVNGEEQRHRHARRDADEHVAADVRVAPLAADQPWSSRSGCQATERRTYGSSRGRSARAAPHRRAPCRSAPKIRFNSTPNAGTWLVPASRRRRNHEDDRGRTERAARDRRASDASAGEPAPRRRASSPASRSRKCAAIDSVKRDIAACGPR